VLVWRAATLGIEEALGLRGGSADCYCRHPGITAGDLKLAMEYVGRLCLSNTLLLTPPDTKWNNVAGNTGGAKHTLCKAINRILRRVSSTRVLRSTLL
jgi:hypothetical protein